MEIGNLLFNHGKGGRFDVPRDAGYEEELGRLFYGEELENNTFVIWPYSWCDCDCGRDEREDKWYRQNFHADTCYQALLERGMKEWDLLHDYDAMNRASNCDVQEKKEYEVLGVKATYVITSRSARAELAFTQYKKLCDERRKHEKDLGQKFCLDLGIDWNNGFGSAVHCTCGYDALWDAWAAKNPHHVLCSAIRPNFLHKPTGFWMTWYKYPLRDAYSSEQLTPTRFREIIDACIASLADDKGGPVLRLGPVAGESLA